MQVSVPYQNLTHTLKSLKIQVIDSLPFMSEYIPGDIKNPEQLFRFLKTKFNYKSDPKGVELLQMVPTLMDRNGKGDCDCGTILTLSAVKYLFPSLQQYVSIVGNSSNGPSHIYSEVWDKDKMQVCAMDLTNPYYCMERKYNYKQRLKFNI